MTLLYIMSTYTRDCVCNHHNYYGWCNCVNCNCIDNMYEKYKHEEPMENYFSGSDETDDKFDEWWNTLEENLKWSSHHDLFYFSEEESTENTQ